MPRPFTNTHLGASFCKAERKEVYSILNGELRVGANTLGMRSSITPPCPAPWHTHTHTHHHPSSSMTGREPLSHLFATMFIRHMPGPGLCLYCVCAFVLSVCVSVSSFSRGLAWAEWVWFVVEGGRWGVRDGLLVTVTLKELVMHFLCACHGVQREEVRTHTHTHTHSLSQ